jgi:competence protein ComEA
MAAPTQAAAATAQGPTTDLRVLALVGAAGAALGAALVALLVLVLGAAPALGLVGQTGQPLEMSISSIETPLSDLDGPLRSVAIDDAGIVVDVAGAVTRPGLQRLQSGARVGDAIEAAGGFAARVDLAEAGRTLNLALPLVDGSKVLVPELGFERVERGPIDDGRIDINTAGSAELETLPGIGPVTAGKIIEARSNERFAAVKQLRSRGIVGESVFQNIRELVRAAA